MRPDVCRHDAELIQFLNSLSDEEHHAYYVRLMAAVAELLVVVEREATTAQALLDLQTHRPSTQFLN
jgi:hypothetical protein